MTSLRWTDDGNENRIKHDHDRWCVQWRHHNNGTITTTRQCEFDVLVVPLSPCDSRRQSRFSGDFAHCTITRKRLLQHLCLASFIINWLINACEQLRPNRSARRARLSCDVRMACLAVVRCARRAPRARPIYAAARAPHHYATEMTIR